MIDSVVALPFCNAGHGLPGSTSLWVGRAGSAARSAADAAVRGSAGLV